MTNSVKNRGIIPKIETTFILPADVKDCLKTEYQSKEITRDALQILNKLTADCGLSPEEIKAIHEKFAANLDFSVTKPFTSRQYRIMGITLPSKLSIRDGLESLKVRVDDNGVFTDISIGDSLFTPPSPDLILRALELGIDAKLVNLKKNPL